VGIIIIEDFEITFPRPFFAISLRPELAANYEFFQSSYIPRYLSHFVFQSPKPKATVRREEQNIQISLTLRYAAISIKVIVIACIFFFFLSFLQSQIGRKL
jgi:hypothetical protein